MGRLATANGGWRRRVTGATSLTVMTSFAGQALLAGSGVAVARLLGIEDRGNFALLVLLPTLLTQAGGLRLPTASTYYLASNEYSSVEVLRAVWRPAIALAGALLPIHCCSYSCSSKGTRRSLPESFSLLRPVCSCWPTVSLSFRASGRSSIHSRSRQLPAPLKRSAGGIPRPIARSP